MTYKEADVFCLVDDCGKPLQPAVQATVLAKYSRSPESARDILSKLTEEEADKFQEKWVVEYGHNCYSDDTEVLTTRGFVKWSDALMTDSFASLNPDSNQIEYIKPVKIINEEYSGQMYRVYGKRVDLLVTPNHKMWVWMKGNATQRSNKKYQLISASEINGKPVAYQLNGDWSGNHLPIINLGARKIEANDLLALMGFFIGDGHSEEKNSKAIYFRLRRPRKIKYLSELCKKIGISIVTHGEDKYYLSEDELGTFMRQCYDHVGEKYIPNWVLQLSKENLLSLFEGLSQSDGSTDRNDHVVYDTTSVTLKEQMFELALKIGFSAYSKLTFSRTTSPDSEKWNQKDLYRVHFNKTKNNPEINKVSYNKQDCYVDYSGKVYCAELPKNHILYVRRNGRCVWSGNSVAELASIAVCFEGISIIASKFIEAWQRPGYSEKSTRYQKFSRDSFVTPPNCSETMKNFASRFYDAYEQMMEPMIEICAEKMGRDPSDRVVKARAFDNLRYLLPAGTGTNVAVNMYVRDARDMICHLRGSSNSELRSLGDKLHDAVYEIVPTLVKHTEPDIFELPITNLGSISSKFHIDEPNWYVDTYKPHLLPNKHVIRKHFESIILERHGMNWESFCKYMDTRSPWQEVPRVFKSLPMSFDIMMDYGAFRDLQRHRRCEQYVEPLTINYGYLVPDDILGSHLEAQYRSVMESIDSYDDESVVHNTDLMQYMIPLGYLHRSIFQMDVRELYYIVELRTKPAGHISYRRVAYDMYKRGCELYPEIMKWCKVVIPDEIGVHN